MDFGYVTHAVHANSRYVELVSSMRDNTVTANGPQNGNIYPPGPGWLFVVVDDVPSKAIKVMIGDGTGPEVSETAIAKYVGSYPAFPQPDLNSILVSCLRLAQMYMMKTKKNTSSTVWMMFR